MRRIWTCVVALAALVAAACSTVVIEQRGLPLHDLTIEGLEVKFALDAAGPFEAKIALEGALRQRLAPTNPYARAVDLVVTIDRAVLATQAQRAAVGVFAGTDVLDVTVLLLDPKTFEKVTSFLVRGAYNEGGAGAYRDPAQRAANTVADVIAQRLGPALMIQPGPEG